MKIIQIVGGIGAGKTTLLESLGNIPKSYTVLKEPVKENPLLDLFYANPKEYFFPMEVFMEDYFCKHVKGDVITDYGIPEVFTNLAFKNGLLSKKEHSILRSLFSDMEDHFLKGYIRVFIFLSTPPEECLERIRNRGRKCEEGITLELCKDLHLEYTDYLSSYWPRISSDTFSPSFFESLF